MKLTWKDVWAMMLVVLGFSTLVWVVSGCDEHKTVPTKVEPPVSVQYMGLVNGCKAQYNPVYCPDWFKPGQLNAGDNIAVLIDENGSAIILNREVVPKILDVIKDK
jgi:hypothetical protein